MRRRWLRRIGIALAVLAIVAGDAWWFLWRPVRPAAAFFTRMMGELPDRAALVAAGRREALPTPLELDGAAALEIPGVRANAPLVIVVGGVTALGVEDPRVARLALALREAGFAVVMPEVWGLAHPGEGARRDEVGYGLEQALVYAWGAAIEEHSMLVSAPRRRVAFLGVSLGGGLVLRAIARGRTTDPSPETVSAVLLIGSPADCPECSKDWFRRPIAPKGTKGPSEEHSGAGMFARRGILRAALPRLVTDAAELEALRTWVDALVEAPASEAPDPAGISSPAARRWLAAAKAENAIHDDDREWVLKAARPFLDETSPSAIDDAHLARISMPVFLIHGEEDPLVPSEEMDRLARRLRAHAPVRTLRSRLLSHVEVGVKDLLETWRHLRFVEDFFDAAGIVP